MAMVKVTYLGDDDVPSSMRDEPIDIDGIKLVRNKPLTIEGNRIGAEKLRKNRFFTVEDISQTLKLPEAPKPLAAQVK